MNSTANIASLSYELISLKNTIIRLQITKVLEIIFRSITMAFSFSDMRDTTNERIIGFCVRKKYKIKCIV